MSENQGNFFVRRPIVAMVIAIIIVLVIGINGVVAGVVTTGVMVMFILYIQQMFQPIMELPDPGPMMTALGRKYGCLQPPLGRKPGMNPFGP